MLIKEIYSTKIEQRDMIEMRDGKLYTFCIAPSRELTMDDLTPFKPELPRNMAMMYSQATPYEGPIRKLQMKFFGLTDCPLKAARQNAGMTQQQLADASGVYVRQIQRIENGEGDISNVTLGNAVKLANALGIDVKELL